MFDPNLVQNDILFEYGVSIYQNPSCSLSLPPPFDWLWLVAVL